jgi:phosphopantothenoylcysteine decarboxylase/phosphopantothenate--cysteine ligase
MLACGEYGMGKMQEPANIVDAILNSLHKNKPLSGYKALVTAGPTREYIDPIRYISNASSGMQGFAIANELYLNGAEVTIVVGPNKENSLMDGITQIDVITTEEMLKQVENISADIFVATAAVCDFKPHTPSCNKIKRSEAHNILLKENVDILSSIYNSKNRPKLIVGFALESDNLIENAKLKLKKCDIVFANDIASINNKNTHLFFISKTNCVDFGPLTKKEAAKIAVAEIIKNFINLQPV